MGICCRSPLYVCWCSFVWAPPSPFRRRHIVAGVAALVNGARIRPPAHQQPKHCSGKSLRSAFPSEPGSFSLPSCRASIEALCGWFTRDMWWARHSPREIAREQWAPSCARRLAVDTWRGGARQYCPSRRRCLLFPLQKCDVPI